MRSAQHPTNAILDAVNTFRFPEYFPKRPTSPRFALPCAVTVAVQRLPQVISKLSSTPSGGVDPGGTMRGAANMREELDVQRGGAVHIPYRDSKLTRLRRSRKPYVKRRHG